MKRETNLKNNFDEKKFNTKHIQTSIQLIIEVGIKNLKINPSFEFD